MISIIIPVYNEENYLQRCLSSIQNQTYKDFEVLMIVNGCTDNSKSICEKFTSDIRFKLFESEKGVSKARNLGLSKMKGDIVCFIDADDYIENGYLQEIYDAFNTYNVDIVARPWRQNKLIKPNQIYTFSKLDFFYDTGYAHRNIYRAELIRNIKFNEQLSLFEDTLFGMEAYYKADKFYILKNNLYTYNLLETGAVKSCTSNSRIRNIDILKNEFRKLYQKYKSEAIKRQSDFFIARKKANPIEWIKFSIITPVYNTSNKVGNCIKSILNQSYKNFELILINDGSTDNSLSVINQFDYDKRIKIFNLDTNSGQCVARNVGLDNVTGDWVMFVDSDDTINKDTLKMYSSIIIKNSDIDLLKTVGLNNKKYFNKKLSLDNAIKNINRLTGATCENIWKWENIKNIRFPFTYKMTHTEMSYSYMCLNTCSNIYFIKNIYYNYIYNANSVSHSKRSEDDWLNLINDYINHIANSSLKKNVKNLYIDSVKYFIDNYLSENNKKECINKIEKYKEL